MPPASPLSGPARGLRTIDVEGGNRSFCINFRMSMTTNKVHIVTNYSFDIILLQGSKSMKDFAAISSCDNMCYRC